MSRKVVNSRKMKINQLINWGAFSIAVLGTLFKVMHWPGANMLLIGAFLFLFIATFLSFKANKENELGDTSNYVLCILLLLLVVGACFKTFHWPGGSELSDLGHIIFLVLPVMILILNKENKVSNSYWVSFLILMFVIISLVRTQINTLVTEKDNREKIEATP